MAVSRSLCSAQSSETCSSTAVASVAALCSFEKTPTTRVRRFTSLKTRLTPAVVRISRWRLDRNDVPARLGDEASKIDYDRMAMIARLVFGTAWRIANTDDRPAVSGTGFN